MDLTPAFLEALTARVAEREAQLASAAAENPLGLFAYFLPVMLTVSAVWLALYLAS